MLITTSRPTAYAGLTSTFAPAATSVTDDTFQGHTVARLDDVATMAALARAFHAKEKPAAALPKELAEAVTTEFGEFGVTTMDDHRLKTLTGFYVEGLETPFFDPIAVLGEGWTEQEQPTSNEIAPTMFSRYGENVIQHVTLDQVAGTTTLHTVHVESFISTRHHEIVQTRDGATTVSDERAS